MTCFAFFFFQAEDGIRDLTVTGVQTCALPICGEDRHLLSPDQVQQITGRLGAVARRLGTSLSALAVAWALATDGVTGSICGARRPEHVQGWIEAADIALDQASLAEFDSIVRTI